MNLQNFLIVFSSVSLSALAQMSFKYGINRVEIPHGTNLFMKSFQFLMSPYVLLGLSFYGIGTVLWLFALREIDLSLAYPFVGMSFVMVFLMSLFLLGEPFNINRMIGSIIIIIGLLFMART